MDRIVNLHSRKITEFTPEDTIYMKNAKDDRGTSYLCQFVSFDTNNWIVTGKVIDEEADEYHMKGKELKAKLANCYLYGNSAGADMRFNRCYWFDGTFRALHPLEESKIHEGALHVEKHPAFGGLSFSRLSGKTVLFGSNIENHSVIAMRVVKMDHRRELNDDSYVAKQELIEVYMTEAQFAQAITSFGIGTPTPCTIHHFNGDRYPEPPYVSPYETFHREFEAKLHNLSVHGKKMVAEAVDILTNKPSIGKQDRAVILKSLETLFMHVSSNLPFALEQFTEKMDEVITEAKQDVKGYTDTLIRDAGLENIQQKLAERASGTLSLGAKPLNDEGNTSGL